MLSCYCASLLLAEPDQLALDPSIIKQQFLADRQNSETISGNHLPVPAPQSLSQSDSLFEPLNIILKPNTEIGPLPKWIKTAPIINKESSTVEIFIPSLTTLSLTGECNIENFAITVNFEDLGDGGPILEKQNDQEKNPSLLPYRLGISGSPLGLNSSTIAIPEDVALDGGKIIVRHTGRFDQIHSIILCPGHTSMVSVLSENFMPAIIMDESTIVEKEESSIDALPFKKGDTTHGRITSAELSACIEQLDGDLEFNFPITGHPEATMFRTEIQGLDLEAHIDVELNGIPLGPLNIASFHLDSPKLLCATKKNDDLPSLQLAGWRTAYIYIPNDRLKEKKSESTDTKTEDETNHLVFIVREGAHPSSSKVHLKNSCLEVLHRIQFESKK
ncbi:MAG: hypothetical protein ACOYK6_02385 [Chthoniobacterales bacterium]